MSRKEEIVKEILGLKDIEVNFIDGSKEPKEGCFHLCPKAASIPEDRAVPGSIKMPCTLCGTFCWVSPDGQRIQAMGKNPMVCLSCAKTIMATKGEN